MHDTQDDTFYKLKQFPFESVKLKIIDLANKGSSAEWRICVLEILSDSGWTEVEYNKEFSKRRTEVEYHKEFIKRRA